MIFFAPEPLQLNLLTVPVKSTVGMRNCFTVYGILLYELPVAAVLLTQSNNNSVTCSVVHLLELQNLNVMKYGINPVK